MVSFRALAPSCRNLSRSMGIQTTSLSPDFIASGDLSKFNAIILGVRSYSVRPDLATYNQRLLDFVHQGGTLIVQYQQGDYNHNYGPYPLSVGTGSAATIADEDSAVQFLLPDIPPSPGRTRSARRTSPVGSRNAAMDSPIPGVRNGRRLSKCTTRVRRPKRVVC